MKGHNVAHYFSFFFLHILGVTESGLCFKKVPKIESIEERDIERRGCHSNGTKSF